MLKPKMFILAESTSIALETDRAINAYDSKCPIVVLEAYGFNGTATDVYWQIHKGQAAPAGGAVALNSVLVGAKQNFSFAPLGGLYVPGPGHWVASTTPGTFTAAAASIWCKVKFFPYLFPGAAP